MKRPLLELETLDAPDDAVRGRQRRALVLTILWHPSARRTGQSAVLSLAPGAAASISRSEPLFGQESEPLASPFVSRRPLIVTADEGDGLTLDPAGGSRVELEGQHLTGPHSLSAARVDEGVVIQLGTHVVLWLRRELVAEERDHPRSRHSLVGVSPEMEALRHQIARAAGRPGAVLVRGETGSGKELVARALHDASARRDKPFVAVNMAAIPSTLAASQLFGHVRGAFSGAERPHEGLFVRADGGTLFLDEIADTAMEVQVALLRVLETCEVHPVGARDVRRVDVRVVAATDADLAAAVASGRFRAPLFFRLAAHEIWVPPLRKRRGDIGRLLYELLHRELAVLELQHLLEPEPTDARPWLPASLVAMLARGTWPGNVRQLRSLAGVMASEATSGHPLAPDDPRWPRPTSDEAPGERASISSPGAVPHPRSTSESKSDAPVAPAARLPRDIDEDELEAVLMAHDYRLAAVASHFGISRPSLNQLIDKHPRLRRARHLEAAEIMMALAREAQDGTPAWRALRVSETGLLRRMQDLGIPR